MAPSPTRAISMRPMHHPARIGGLHRAKSILRKKLWIVYMRLTTLRSSSFSVVGTTKDECYSAKYFATKHKLLRSTRFSTATCLFH